MLPPAYEGGPCIISYSWQSLSSPFQLVLDILSINPMERHYGPNKVEILWSMNNTARLTPKSG
jgi:hypothetical protein